MAVTIRIHNFLRAAVGGGSFTCTVNARDDVRGTLSTFANLVDRPGTKFIDDEGQVHWKWAVFVDDEHIRDSQGMATRDSDGDEISIVPAYVPGDGLY